MSGGFIDVKHDGPGFSSTGAPAGGPSPWVQGAWNMNLGGSGTSFQGAAAGGTSMPSTLGLGSGLGGLPPLLIAALVVGAAWLYLRR